MNQIVSLNWLKICKDLPLWQQWRNAATDLECFFLLVGSGNSRPAKADFVVNLFQNCSELTTCN